MHVAASVGNVHAKAGGEGLPGVGLVIAISVAEFPEVRRDGGAGFCKSWEMGSRAESVLAGEFDENVLQRGFLAGKRA